MPQEHFIQQTYTLRYVVSIQNKMQVLPSMFSINNLLWCFRLFINLELFCSYYFKLLPCIETTGYINTILIKWIHSLLSGLSLSFATFIKGPLCSRHFIFVIYISSTLGRLYYCSGCFSDTVFNAGSNLWCLFQQAFVEHLLYIKH